MVDAIMRKFMKSYIEVRPKADFFTGMFRLKEFNSTKIIVDVRRANGEIAIAIKSLRDEGRAVTLDRFTNKEYEPPIFKEFAPVNVHDQSGRQMGQGNFEDVNIIANAINQTQLVMSDLEERQNAAYELQASQVMQTGTATLIDPTGAEMFAITYYPKASHFPISGTTASYGGVWGGGSETVLVDIDLLCQQVKTDGKKTVTDLIFGSKLWPIFKSEVAVAGGNYDIIRMDQGTIRPFTTVGGANNHGTLVTTSNQFNLWTYDAEYTHPQTSVVTKYMDPTKLIAMSQSSHRTAAFGHVPKLIEPDRRLRSFIPQRRINGDGKSYFVDGRTDGWGDNLEARLSSRGLYIPTDIDTFGCLKAKA